MAEPWHFNPRCNDCRADLQAVLDELVDLREIEQTYMSHREDGTARYATPPYSLRRKQEQLAREDHA